MLNEIEAEQQIIHWNFPLRLFSPTKSGLKTKLPLSRSHCLKNTVKVMKKALFPLTVSTSVRPLQNLIKHKSNPIENRRFNLFINVLHRLSRRLERDHLVEVNPLCFHYMPAPSSHAYISQQLSLQN